MYQQSLSVIYLYDEPNAIGLDVNDIGGFLASELSNVEVVPRSDFFTHQIGRFSGNQRQQVERETIRRVQQARVELPQPDDGADNTSPETDDDQDLDFIFRARPFQSILRILIDPQESRIENLHILLTNNVIVSRSPHVPEYRLHGIAMGAPSIISLTGLVEALPRPKEYQFRRAHMAMMGMPETAIDELDKQFADRTFGYHDPRINEVAKGYALMACFYRMTGQAFCPDPECRLHPAQDQAELIELQSGRQTGLCERHQLLLAELNASDQ